MQETLQEINIQWIVENPSQPRKSFSLEELKELAASIQEIGLIHAPVVREIGSNKFELIAGERRLRALKLLGRQFISVVVTKKSSQVSAHSALIENIQRVDLNAMEVAYALKELMTHLKLTQELLADKVGKKRSTVANFLRLLHLPENIQSLLRENKLSMGHAKALLSVPHIHHEKLAARIMNENLTVREAENAAQELLKEKKKEKKPVDVHLSEIKSLLEIKYGTKIEVNGSKIVMDYYGWDDLDRLLELLGVK